MLQSRAHTSTDDDDVDDVEASSSSAPLVNVTSSSTVPFTTATTITGHSFIPSTSSRELHPVSRRGAATVAARMAIRRRSAYQSSSSLSSPAALKTRFFVSHLLLFTPFLRFDRQIKIGIVWKKTKPLNTGGGYT